MNEGATMSPHFPFSRAHTTETCLSRLYPPKKPVRGRTERDAKVGLVKRRSLYHDQYDKKKL